MINEFAETLITIPGSDGLICSYGGVVLFDVTVENASPPAADLVFYDNTAGSGAILAVIPATGPNQTYPVRRQAHKAIYITGTSGWTGSIGVSS